MKKLYSLLALLFIFNISANKSAFAQAFKSDTIDILHYSINLDLSTLSVNELKGFTDIKMHPKMVTNSFSLDLVKLSVDSIFINGAKHNQYTYNDTVIHFTTWTLNQSDTINIRVYYHGTPKIEPYNWGGFHFLSDSSLAYNLGVAFEDYPHNYGRVWYPCIDDFKDRATYDFHITTKTGMQAVCGGYLYNSTVSGNKTHWHWKLEQPIPTYLSSVAVSDFAVVEGVYYGIEDTIPTYVYVRPQDSAKATVAFSNLNNMMSIYESRFGPYRWPRVGYVGTTKGAMEHATNIAFPRNLIQNNNSYDWLVAHELAHHWFGDLVTCETAEDMWINEGWAVFSEAIFMEGMYGWENYKNYIMNIQRDVIQYAHTPGQDGAYYPMYPIPQTITYGTTVYDKGGLMAHTLRGYMGDSLFFSSVKGMLSDLAFTDMSSYEMRDYLSSKSGMDLTGFYDNWIFEAGFPHYSVDSFRVLSTTGLYDVEVFVHQKRKARTTFGDDNRVELGFFDASGNVAYRIMEFDGEFGNQTFQLSFIPEIVLMDPEDRLADAITSKTKELTQTGQTNFDDQMFKINVTHISDTVLFRIEHNWVAPDPMFNNPTGLTLSDARYWTVSGIFPTGFEATGQFYFSKSSTVDAGLLQNLNDSLIILYRANAGQEWRGIPFTKTPSNNAGYITVANLKAGQYTLAVWDEQYIDIHENKKDEEGMNIYPNPCKDEIRVEIEGIDSAEAKIFDITGSLVLYRNIDFTGGSAILNTSDLPNGTYQLQITDDSETAKTAKLIINN